MPHISRRDLELLLIGVDPNSDQLNMGISGITRLQNSYIYFNKNVTLYPAVTASDLKHTKLGHIHQNYMMIWNFLRILA